MTVKDFQPFPCASTRFRACSQIAKADCPDTVCSLIDSTPGLSLVRFVLYEQGQFDVFHAALNNWLPQ